MSAIHVIQPIVTPDAPYLQEKVGKVLWAFSWALSLSLAASYHLLSLSPVQVRTELVASP